MSLWAVFAQAAKNTKKLVDLIEKVDQIPSDVWDYPERLLRGYIVYPTDVIRAQSLPEVSNDTTTYVKVKEFKLNVAGQVRITYDNRRTGQVRDVQTRVYRNGVYLSPYMTSNSSLDSQHVLDVPGWQKDDLLQLYLRISSTDAVAFISNVRIRYSMELSDLPLDPDVIM